LYARGLLVSRGNQQATLLFEDVDEVWFEIGRLHSDQGAFLRALRLVDFDGRQRRVPLVVEDALRLSKAILRGASLPLLLQARRALDRGETLTFGTTTIDRDGLSISGAAAAWKDIRLARVQPARVSFFQRRPLFPWRVVRLDRIPNPTVFAALVAQKVRNVKYDDRLMVPLGPDATD